MENKTDNPCLHRVYNPVGRADRTTATAPTTTQPQKLCHENFYKGHMVGVNGAVFSQSRKRRS